MNEQLARILIFLGLKIKEIVIFGGGSILVVVGLVWIIAKFSIIWTILAWVSGLFIVVIVGITLYFILEEWVANNWEKAGRIVEATNKIKPTEKRRSIRKIVEVE